MKENIIQHKSFQFAKRVFVFYQFLLSQKEFIILRQLLKSATSIGANIEELIAAQSQKDFISKMSIASKESRETLFWLRLLSETNFYDYDIKELLDINEEIVKVLTSIVKTTIHTNYIKA